VWCGMCRSFCDRVLIRFGVDVEYYHPTTDEHAIEARLRPETRVRRPRSSINAVVLVHQRLYPI
jgi:hypothetical protein